MAVKTFTTGEVLTAADTNTYLNNGGLVYIGATTLNAVTNNISNVFSSDYAAYRVVVSGLNNGSTTTRTLSLRFRTTTDDTTANYYQANYYAYPTNNSGIGSLAGQTSATIGAISQGTYQSGTISMDIINPNIVGPTFYQGHLICYQSDVVQFVFRSIWGAMNTATQYTGFSIIGATDNLSGTVRVYGYRQA